MSEKLQIVLSRFSSLCFNCFFFSLLNCGCASCIDSFMRNVRIDEHQATSNYGWCLSVKERRVGRLFPERNIGVRIGFSADMHIYVYICTYLCMCIVARIHTRKSLERTGDPKWLLTVASVGLMLHKSCHEVLVQLTNTVVAVHEREYRYIIFSLTHTHTHTELPLYYEKGSRFSYFQASEFCPIIWSDVWQRSMTEDNFSRKQTDLLLSKEGDRWYFC